jgi:hypothetical protein
MTILPNTNEAAIQNFLFNIEKDPTDSTKPFPIKEIVSIDLIPVCSKAHVEYLDTSNNKQSVTVFEFEL